MGFGSYIGGLALCLVAVLVAVFGIVVLVGFISMVPASFSIILGIILLIIALFLFLYGRYLYMSAKPKGTLNVHNQ
jgi:high-affinity Fe2+/Pb2+ permease